MTKADDKRALATAQELAGHTLCRPPRDALPVKSEFAGKLALWRLGTDGYWREDNMQPGLAFIGMLDDNVIVWTSSCKCTFLHGCSAGAGGAFALDKLDLPTVQYHRRRSIANVRKSSRR